MYMYVHLCTPVIYACKRERLTITISAHEGYTHLQYTCTPASHACKRERLAAIQYQLVKVTHSRSTPVTSIPLKNPQTQVQCTYSFIHCNMYMYICFYSTCIYMYVYMYCHGLCINNVHVHNIMYVYQSITHTRTQIHSQGAMRGRLLLHNILYEYATLFLVSIPLSTESRPSGNCQYN